MIAHTEIVPTEDQVRSLSQGVLLPTLNQIAKDSGRRLALTASIMVGADRVNTLPNLSVGKPEDAILDGELRLRFREAFGGRVLMHCECIFKKAQAVSNCSGFSLKGELKGSVARRTAWTMRYSVWNWTGWV
jgi:hypothetical protein